MRYAGPTLLLAIGLLVVDYYVFRNWKRFAQTRPRLSWTTLCYRILMVVMPWTLPIYVATSRWYAVEPALLRAAAIGFWLLYYVPKFLLAAGLLVKDVGRFIYWLFEWLRHRPVAEPPPQHEPAGGRVSLEGARTEPPNLSGLHAMTRSEFLRKVGWTLGTAPYLLVGYSLFRTLYDFRIHRVTVPVAQLPPALDGLRLVQLSDLHAGSLFSERVIEDTVAMAQSLQPDAILITGDFVNHDAAEYRLIGPALSRLQAPLGVYACLGNHDHYARVQDVVAHVRASGIRLLVNQSHTLSINGARLHILGTDNSGFGQQFGDMDRTRANLRTPLDQDAFAVLLTHTPDYWDHGVRPAHSDIGLTLSGHTHGGQIGFEWGPLRWSLARIMYPRWAGLYEEPCAEGAGTQFLYVNRGIGTIGPPVRLGIQPEITVLTLRRT